VKEPSGIMWWWHSLINRRRCISLARGMGVHYRFSLLRRVYDVWMEGLLCIAYFFVVNLCRHGSENSWNAFAPCLKRDFNMLLSRKLVIVIASLHSDHRFCPGRRIHA
jgi:hypothetical protein